MKYNHLGYTKSQKEYLNTSEEHFMSVRGRVFQNGRQISIKYLVLVQIFVFRQFLFSLME